jgi:integrase
MSAYIAKGRTVAKIKVRINGKWKAKTTGTRDPNVVKRMQHMIDQLHDPAAEAESILAKLAGEWTMLELYRRWQDCGGRLMTLRNALADELLVEFHARFRQAVVARTKQRDADTAKHYQVTLNRLEDGGIRRLSDLTVAKISAWLDAQPGKASTRRKAAMAVSAFCTWLVRAGALQSNPVRDVPKPKAGPARVSFIDEATMIRLADAQPSPFREFSALIHGTGLDVGAAVALTRDQVDLTTWGITQVRPKSGRRHTVLVAEWARPYVQRLLDGKLGRAPLREIGVDRWTLSDAHREACKAIGLENYWLRDARHSWAVRFAKHGGSAAQGAEQLGHSDGGVLFLRVYGAHAQTLEERAQVERRVREARG